MKIVFQGPNYVWALEVVISLSPLHPINDGHHATSQPKWLKRIHSLLGSGKTTLLALLTGDHLQSYTQAHLHLPSLTASLSSPSATSPPTFHDYTFRHRKKTPTAHLCTLVGVVFPEMFNAFPRWHPGMNIWEAVGTGFNSGFILRNHGATTKSTVGWVDVDDEELGSGWYNFLDHEKEAKREDIQKWRVWRCWEVLEALGPASWNSSLPLESSQVKTLPSLETVAFTSTNFSPISPGKQRLVLLMCALVSCSPLVLLDEAWSGMDDKMIAAARQYLHGDFTVGTDGMAGIGEDQAIVVITHWEDEVMYCISKQSIFYFVQKLEIVLSKKKEDSYMPCNAMAHKNK